MRKVKWGIKVQVENYQTVKETAITEVIIRKSRFISHVTSVQNADEAIAFVNKIKGQHREANHNVSAWIVDEKQLRCSDDGEPSGTAGRPVLEVIKKTGLIHTAVVVTRYFGGILLGAGGLVRAYSESAQEGIAAAGTRVVQLYRVLELQVDYPLANQIKYYLEEQQVTKLTVQYEEQVIFRACCLPSQLDNIDQTVNEITGGRVKVHHREDSYL